MSENYKTVAMFQNHYVCYDFIFKVLDSGVVLNNSIYFDFEHFPELKEHHEYDVVLFRYYGLNSPVMPEIIEVFNGNDFSHVINEVYDDLNKEYIPAVIKLHMLKYLANKDLVF